MLPWRCLRCGEQFQLYREWEKHLRAQSPCEIRQLSWKREDGVNVEQLSALLVKLRQSRSEISEKERWRDMYAIVFPEDAEADIPPPCELPSMHELGLYWLLGTDSRVHLAAIDATCPPHVLLSAKDDLLSDSGYETSYPRSTFGSSSSCDTLSSAATSSSPLGAQNLPLSSLPSKSSSPAFLHPSSAISAGQFPGNSTPTAIAQALADATSAPYLSVAAFANKVVLDKADRPNSEETPETSQPPIKAEPSDSVSSISFHGHLADLSPTSQSCSSPEETDSEQSQNLSAIAVDSFKDKIVETIVEEYVKTVRQSFEVADASDGAWSESNTGTSSSSNPSIHPNSSSVPGPSRKRRMDDGDREDANEEGDERERKHPRMFAIPPVPSGGRRLTAALGPVISVGNTRCHHNAQGAGSHLKHKCKRINM